MQASLQQQILVTLTYTVFLEGEVMCLFSLSRTADNKKTPPQTGTSFESLFQAVTHVGLNQWKHYGVEDSLLSANPVIVDYHFKVCIPKMYFVLLMSPSRKIITITLDTGLENINFILRISFWNQKKILMLLLKLSANQ